MVIQIIKENRKPSTGEKFSAAFGELLKGGQQLMDQQAKAKALQTAGLPEGYNLLPEQAQAAIAKKTFAEGLNAKDQSIIKKNEALTRAADKKTDYWTENERLAKELFPDFNKTGGNNFSNQIMQEPQIPQEIQDQENPEIKKEDWSNPSSLSQKTLDKAKGFKSEKGPLGIRANIAIAEDEKRKELKQEETRKKEREEDRSFKEKVEFHKETSKFDASLQEQATAAKKKNAALQQQMRLQPKITNWDRFAKAAFGQSKWGNLLSSKNAQEFDAYSLPQLEGQRQILGGILSDSDIRLLMQKIVTADKNPEANQEIAKWMTLQNDLSIAKNKIAQQIKDENGGYRPRNFEKLIDDKYNEQYGQKIQDQANIIKSLADNPEKYKEITGREKVKQGTVLTPKIATEYLLRNNYDREQAELEAKEDGYDWPK